LNKCEKLYKDGEIKTLDASLKEMILNKNLNLAEKALRVLAVAYKDIEAFPHNLDAEHVEQNLNFVRISAE
jgi:Ca2+-transporting ATPase